ncbi:MAG TPA: SDR family oxidoreductase [Beijerinckiaceae bacterium]
MNLFVFGFGYSASHYARTRRGRFAHIAGTARSVEKRDALRAEGFDAHALEEPADAAALDAALAEATHVLVSAPPGPEGDPSLARFADALRRGPALRCVVYLSTVGVYGDHGGAWIDETTPPAPTNARSAQRLQAEDAWRALARARGASCHVLRLSGIYGPGRNALRNLRAGTAKRIVKPGQVFNRIHVEDIARAIDACFDDAAGPRDAVWNVTDDAPAPPQDVVAYAAARLGVEPPPEQAFDAAQMTPMARSFYSECKRVSNGAIKRALGWSPAYPTYREAIDALLAAGEGRQAASGSDAPPKCST